jgi:hypothetical protein
MFGPRHRVERAVVAAHIAQLFCPLSPIENASLVGEGFTRAASDSAVGNGTSRGVAAVGGLHHRYERQAA